MKLMVNLNILKPPLTGVGQYVYRILKELLKEQEITEICGFKGFHWFKDKEEVTQYLEGLKGCNLNVNYDKMGKYKRFLAHYALVRLAYGFVRDIVFSYHAQKDFIYWDGGFTPIYFKGKMVITVHDLSYIRYAEFHPKERVLWMQHILPNAIKRSCHILTVSEFSKKEIIDIFKIDACKISVVHPPISDSFKAYRQEECQEVLQKYHLQWKSYILSVATLEPRKNLERLLDAYMLFEKDIKKQYPLVLVGAIGWLDNELHKKLEKLKYNGYVMLLGYVHDDILPFLYASAACFAYVSLYEGYGMPIAESLKSNTICIASCRGAMLEAGGEGAIYVDPMDIHDIALGLKKGLQKNQEAIIKHNNINNPAQAAQKLLELLKKVERLSL